jgi:hypothetical protein
LAKFPQQRGFWRVGDKFPRDLPKGEKHRRGMVDGCHMPMERMAKLNNKAIKTFSVKHRRMGK